MGNIIPQQSRTVDPFTEFNSNVINSLTKAITGDKDAIFTINALNVTIASSTQVEVSRGVAFMQDVVITVEEDFTIDFTDQDFYVEDFPGGPKPPAMDVTGNYYVVLDYTYEKIKPPPVARYRILKPGQHARILESRFLFLKTVHVSNTGSFVIDNVFDFDPNDISVTREYSPTFIGYENTRPTYQSSLHKDKLIFEASTSTFYKGDDSAGDWSLVAGGIQDGDLGEVWGGQLKSPRFKNTQDSTDVSTMEGMILDLDNEFLKLGGGNDPNRYSMWFNKDDDGNLHFGSGAIQWDNLDDTSKNQITTELKVIYNPDTSQPTIPATSPGLAFDDGDLDGNWSFDSVDAVWASMATRNGVVWSAWSTPFKLSGGQNAYSTILTNAHANVSVNYDGTLKANSLDNISTEVLVFLGTQQYTYNNALDTTSCFRIPHTAGVINGTACDATIDTTTGIVSLTSLSANTGLIDFTVETSDGVTIDAMNWRIVKIFDGTDGASKLVSLSSDEGFVFNHDSATTLTYPSDGKITLTANVYGMDATDLEWQYWDPTLNAGAGDWSTTFASGVSFIEIDGLDNVAPNFDGSTETIRTFRALVDDPLAGIVWDSQPIMHIQQGLQGPAGDANYVWLESTPNLFFKYDESGTPIDYTTITLTAYKNNISAIDYRWSYYLDGTGWIDIPASDDQSTHIVSHTEITGPSLTFRVSLDNTGNTRFDHITLGKVVDGQSSYQVFLSNNSHGIPTDAAGDVLTGGYTGAYTDIQAFIGATELDWEAYDSTTGVPSTGHFTVNEAAIIATGITATLDSQTGRITYSNITTNSATIDIPVIFPNGTTLIVSASAYKAYSGTDGINAYTVVLTNENHTIITDPIGIPITGELGLSGKAKTEIIAYRGTTEYTYTSSDTPIGTNYAITGISWQTGGSGWTYVEDTTGGVVYINSITGTSDDNGILLIDVLFPDGITITKSLSLNKSKGVGIVNLNSDSLVIKYDTSGDLDSPASILLAAETVGITTPTYKWFVKYDGLGDFVQFGGTDSTEVITSPATSSTLFNNIATYKVEVYENSSPTTLIDSDIVTISKFENIRGNDGVGTYTVVLTNESHTVSVDPGGNPETGEIGTSGRAISEIIAYYEGTEYTYSSSSPVAGTFIIENITYPSGTGWVINVNTSTGELYISSLATTASPTATVAFDIRFSDGTILKKVWSLDKKVNAMTVDLVASDQYIVYDTVGSLISQPTITLNASTFGTSGSTIWYKWYVRYDSGISWGTPFQQGTQTSYELTCPLTKTGLFNDKATYKVEISLSSDQLTVLDEDIITIVKAQNIQGDPGETGVAGTGYTATLSNESHTVRCNGTGTPIAGEIGLSGKASSLVTAFINSTQLSYTGSDSPSTGQFGINNIVVSGTGWSVLENTGSGGLYVSALTTTASDTCTVTCNILFPGGISIPKVWTLNKVVNAPVVNVNSTYNIIKYSTTGTLVAPSSFTMNITQYGGISPQYDWYRSIDGGAFTLELSNQTATSRTISSFTFFSSSVVYEVRMHEAGSAVVLDTDRTTITKVQDGAAGAAGASGVNAYTVSMSNEAHEIGVNDDGTYVYTGASTDFTVFKGNVGLTATTAVPTSGQFRIVVGTQTNCTASRTASNTVTVSAVTSDTASVDITVELEGTSTTVSKRMSLTRSKSNKSIRLSADTLAFTYDSPTDTSATPTTSNLSVELIGGITSPVYAWQYKPVGGNWTSLAGNISSYIITASDVTLFPGSNKSCSFKCTVTSNGVSYSDEITIYKVYGGATGATGATGPQGLPGQPGENGLEYWINPEFSAGTFFIQQPGYNGSLYTHFLPTATTITVRHAGTETVQITTLGLNTNDTNTTVSSGWSVTIAPRTYSSYRYITAADGIATITLVGLTSGIRKVYKIQRLREVDGTYIGSNGIYSGSITANQITAGTLNAGLITVTNLSASSITAGILRSSGAGNLAFDVDNAYLKVVNNASIKSYNASTEATSTYYSNLSAAALTFYARASTASAWTTYQYVSRIESGTVNDNTYVTFPIPYRTVPKIILSMNDAMVYDASFPGSDQSVRMEAQTISTSGFRARLYHDTGSGGLINTVALTTSLSLSQTRSWTAPAGTQSAKVTISVYPNTVTNVEETYYIGQEIGTAYSYSVIYIYSTVARIQYQSGASWITIGTFTQNSALPLSSTQTFTVNLPSANAWPMRILYEASTANGSATNYNGPYNLAYERRVNPVEVQHFSGAVTATDPNSRINYIALGS